MVSIFNSSEIYLIHIKIAVHLLTLINTVRGKNRGVGHSSFATAGRLLIYWQLCNYLLEGGGNKVEQKDWQEWLMWQMQKGQFVHFRLSEWEYSIYLCQKLVGNTGCNHHKEQTIGWWFTAISMEIKEKILFGCDIFPLWDRLHPTVPRKNNNQRLWLWKWSR